MANLNLNNFKDKIKGFTKTSLMEVKMNPPKNLNKFSGEKSEEILRFTCENARLPGYIFKTENRLISGLTSEIPVGFEHERLTLTFLCSSEMFERKFFDAWIHLIQNPETLRFSYYDDYVTDIIISSLNVKGDPVYTVIYKNAYPNIITSQNLSWAEDNVLRLTVDFSYEKWITEESEKSSNENNKNEQSSTEKNIVNIGKTNQLEDNLNTSPPKPAQPVIVPNNQNAETDLKAEEMVDKNFEEQKNQTTDVNGEPYLVFEKEKPDNVFTDYYEYRENGKFGPGWYWEVEPEPDK